MEGSPPLELPPGLLAGRLEGTGVPDLLWALCSRRCSGVLHLTGSQLDKTLYIEHGRIVFARSANPDDRLGVLFLQQQVVTLDQLETASKEIGAGKRLGTLLVEAGILTPERLVRSVVEQVERIVIDLFALQGGEYRFHEGELPVAELITLDIPTKELLLRGIRDIQSFTRIRRNVGGPATRYSLTDNWHEALSELELGEGDRLLIERLESGSATVEMLCREVFLSNFEIYQTLWGFKVLDAVRRIDRIEEAGGERTPLAREGFIDVVLGHARALETGVLYAVHGSTERTFHLSEGRCIFATSSDPDDGLVAHLLRGGVISLSDREETAKRLLSNKRVGTILLELGVIDHDDLRRMVRQQVTEVMYDTFRWESPELAFAAGPLPSVEEITVDLSVESLIREGLRRVDSWSRIRQGCGGLGSILALTPDYLQVLDSMQAGEDEWQIVTALRTPRTPLEICRQSDLGDFRVCRILWALRVLNAIEVLQAESERIAPATGESFDTPAEPGAPLVAPTVDVVVEHAPETVSEEIPVLGTDVVEAGSVAYTPSDMEVVADSLPVWSALPVVEESPDTTEDAAAGSDEVEAEEPEQPEQPPDAPPRVETPAASTVVEAKSETIEQLEAAIDVDDTGEDSAVHDGLGENVEQARDKARGDDAWDLDDVAQTVRLSPEEVQAALNPEHTAAAAGTPTDGIETPGQQQSEAPTPRIEGSGEPEPVAPVHDLNAEAVECETHAEAETEAELEAAVEPETEPETETALASEPDRESELESQELEIAVVVESVETAPTREPGAAATPDQPDDGAEDAGIDDLELDSDLADDDQERESEVASIEVEAVDGPGEPPFVADFELPEDIEAQIARFNTMQRIIYRAVRTEVGAGAANFIRSCCGPEADGDVAPLVGVELLGDGSWDADGLRQAVEQQRIGDPGSGFLAVIEREIDELRTLIGDERANELQRRLERSEPRGPASS